MSYKIVKQNNEFRLYEIASKQYIKTFKKHNEANKYMKFLKNGGSWSGWTPSFILNINTDKILE